MYLLIRPHPGAGEFLAICARGFADPTMPAGVYALPNPAHLCAVAGGYGYIIDTTTPTTSTQIPLRPITAIAALPEHNLLLCCGFHTVIAWGSEGAVWTTARLSWDGIQLGEVEGGYLAGLGWDMMTDRDVPFSIDLRTGRHTGGGFRPAP